MPRAFPIVAREYTEESHAWQTQFLASPQRGSTHLFYDFLAVIR